MEKDAYKKMYDFEDSHWWFVARRNIIQTLIQQQNKKDQANKILEIGSGTGGNISMLSEFGQVTAVEPDQYAAELSGKKNKITVIQSNIEGLEPTQFEEKFDFILLLDVLEHIEDPSLALEKIKHLSSRETVIILTTPAYQFLWGPHDIEHHHYRRHTKKNLSHLILESGLSITRISYMNTLLFPLVLVSRLINKVMAKKVVNDSKMPSQFVNNTLNHTFKSEKHLLKHFNLPFGCSLIAMCELRR